jgi:hypothetical protein
VAGAGGAQWFFFPQCQWAPRVLVLPVVCTTRYGRSCERVWLGWGDFCGKVGCGGCFFVANLVPAAPSLSMFDPRWAPRSCFACPGCPNSTALSTTTRPARQPHRHRTVNEKLYPLLRLGWVDFCCKAVGFRVCAWGCRAANPFLFCFSAPEGHTCVLSQCGPVATGFMSQLRSLPVEVGVVLSTCSLFRVLAPRKQWEL